jgi:hypothetical protein
MVAPGAEPRLDPALGARHPRLLRLAEEGGSALGLQAERLDAAKRRERAEAALKRLRSLVDAEVLLSDAAWR